MKNNIVPLPVLHVALERLQEAVDSRDNLTRDEWLHIQECRSCLEAFVEIIRKTIAA